MIAVVDIAGQQFKVSENGKYYVPRLKDEVDTEIVLDKVLLVTSGEGTTKVGTPYVGDAKVHAKVIAHLKDDKVIVFKKKRRTGYQKSNGHRQHLTRIQIVKIG